MIHINTSQYILSNQQRKSKDAKFLNDFAEKELSFSKISLERLLSDILIEINSEIILNLSLQRNFKLKIDYSEISDKREMKIIKAYLLEDENSFWNTILRN